LLSGGIVLVVWVSGSWVSTIFKLDALLQETSSHRLAGPPTAVGFMHGMAALRCYVFRARVVLRKRYLRSIAEVKR